MAKQRRRRNRTYTRTLPRDIQRSMAAGAEPLPDDKMDEPALLQRWRQRAQHARRIREQWERGYAVEMLERYYLGKHLSFGDYDLETAEFWVNNLSATVQTQRPSLLPTTISFFAKPKAGQQQADRLQVKALAAVLDAIATQDDHLMPSVRLAMTQAFFRIGVLKACYDPRLEANPQAGESLYQKDRDGQLVIDPNTGDYVELVDPATQRPVREPDEIVTDDVFRWRWVNARNMLLPDEGPDMTRWTWQGEEIEVPLEVAREDTRFPADKRSALRANGVLRATDQTPRDSADGMDHDRAMFRYVECWDHLSNKLYVWADGQSFDEFLLNGPVPDGVEEDPYALLSLIPISAPQPSPWPKPVVFDWLPLQQQYNILRTQMINAGKRSSRKYYYTKGTFPDADEAQKALASHTDMQGVEINDATAPPEAIADPNPPTNIAQNIPYLQNDWQRVTGATGTRLGGAAGSDTATEAVLAEQSAGVRDSEFRSMVFEWLSRAGRKMAQLVRQNLSLDLWVTIKDIDDEDFQEFLASPGLQAYLGQRIGVEQVPQFLQLLQVAPHIQEELRAQFGKLKPLRVTRSQLEFEADILVVPSTIRPIYRAQLLQLTNILGPLALSSPTLLEELLQSFELPQGARIAQEIITNVQRQQQQAAAQALGSGSAGAGRQQVPGTPTPQSAASPLGTQNPLGAVSGLRSVV